MSAGGIASGEAFDRTALDAYLRSSMADWRVPGMAVAVLAGDEILLLEGYGLRNIESERPVTPDTLFVAASTTKAFTSLGVGMLVDRGAFQWDQPVSGYLSEFVLAEEHRTYRVTVRDMLSHRTGLPRHDLLWYGNDDLNRSDLVRRLRHLEANAPIRSRWQYNNLMYLTAGYIIEQFSGQTWEEYTTHRILEPLAMHRTNFSVNSMAQDDNHATPYKLDEQRRIVEIPFRNVDVLGPAGSINSTAADLANWVRLHLGGGVFEGEQLIDAATLAETHAPQMPLGTKPEFPEFSPPLYGLAWFIDSYRGHTRVQHGGNLDGFTARVTLFPDAGVGSVVLVNMEASPLPAYLSLDIADRQLGLEPKRWAETMLERRDLQEAARDDAKSKQQSMRIAGTQPTHALSDYAAVYHHPGYGDLEVMRQGRKLMARYNTAEVTLEHWHYDVFNSQLTRPEDDGLENKRFQFSRDVDGQVAFLRVDLEALTPPIEFHRLPDPRLSDPAYLQRFVGRYQFLDQIWSVELAGTHLVLQIPGQRRQTLEPTLRGEFRLRDIASIGVDFIVSGETSSGMQLRQPDGLYELSRIDD